MTQISIINIARVLTFPGTQSTRHPLQGIPSRKYIYSSNGQTKLMHSSELMAKPYLLSAMQSLIYGVPSRSIYKDLGTISLIKSLGGCKLTPELVYFVLIQELL